MPPRVHSVAVVSLTVAETPPEPAVAPRERYAAWIGTLGDKAALSEVEMRAVLTYAGWSDELLDEALTITWCESRWQVRNVGDHGAAHGLWQIHSDDTAWHGIVDDPWDPVQNSRLALYIYTLRGRFGGMGGWGNCSALNGIY